MITYSIYNCLICMQTFLWTVLSNYVAALRMFEEQSRVICKFSFFLSFYLVNKLGIIDEILYMERYVV